MSRFEKERRRRTVAADQLQRVLIAFRAIRMAIDDCDLATAREACAEMGIALELVESEMGVVTPASLFDIAMKGGA